MRRLAKRFAIDNIDDLFELDDEVNDLVEIDEDYSYNRENIFVYIDGNVLYGDTTHGDLLQQYFKEKNIDISDDCVDKDDVNMELDELNSEIKKIKEFSSGEINNGIAIIYFSDGVSDEKVAKALNRKTYVEEDDGLRRIK